MKTESTLLVILLALILTATVVGVSSRSEKPPIVEQTVRGQSAEFVAEGIYRYNPVALAREGEIWDAVNLVIGLPLTILAFIGALKGRLRARLLLGGLLAYFFYVYLSCVMMYAFNNLFLVYVAILGLSLVGFFLNLRHISVSRLEGRLLERFPRRLFIGYSFVLAFALLVLWGGRIIPVMRSGRFPTELAGVLTYGSQALDLGLLVPLSISTAVYLWKRESIGYLLCSIAMPIGLMMFISIPAWITVPLIQAGAVNLIEAIPFYLLSLIGLGVAALFFVNIAGGSEGKPAKAVATSSEPR